MPQAASRHIDVIVESFEQAASHARNAANNEQSVLWIRSTVSDAIADFQLFDASGIKSLLHHSRYAVEDLSWLDQQLLSIFGLNGDRGGVIAVTTQTAEQSLDIDADLLITDACPADVLLQRLGRMHRHRSTTRPTAVVIDPGDLNRDLLPKGKVVGYPATVIRRCLQGMIRDFCGISKKRLADEINELRDQVHSGKLACQ